MAAAEQLYSDQTVDGVRLVRLEHYVDYDFTDSVIIFKRMVGETTEADPLAPANDAGSVFCWRQVADFYRERGRDELRAQLGRYMEDKRVTVSELIHSEKHSIDLDNAGTILQGVFQKVAVPLAQTSGGKISAATLFKDMMSLWSQLVLQLRNDANAVKVVKLEPAKFVELAAQLEKQFGADYIAYKADVKRWIPGAF